MSLNSGSFVGTGEMKNMEWLAIRFANLVLWGPPYGELLKNEAIGKSRANGWGGKIEF